MKNVLVTIMVAGGPIRGYIDVVTANRIDDILAVSKAPGGHIDVVMYDMPYGVAENKVRLRCSAICGMIRHSEFELED